MFYEGYGWTWLCWDLGMLRAIIYITSEHNASKNNRNKLFSTVLSWFDLAVTLRWCHHYLGIIPIWNQTPTDVTMCTWIGFWPIYWKCWSNNVHCTFNHFELISPCCDLQMTLPLRWDNSNTSNTNTIQHLHMSPRVLVLGFVFIPIPPILRFM